MGLAFLKDLQLFRRFEIVEERHTGKKLGFVSSLLRRKIAQIGLQQLGPALGQVIDMAIRLSLLLHHLSHHRPHLFKVFQGWVQDRIIERDGPAKYALNSFFYLVAMLW